MIFDAIGCSFLVENRLMDSREWFHEHKDIYVEHVLRPMQKFVTDITPAMLRIDPGFIVEPKIGKCISRLNRDTRFTKDKSLYRDHMWCVFTRNKHEDYPCFFFEVSPDGFSYGCGYYQATPAVMEQMRQMILKDDPLFLKMQKAHSQLKGFDLYADWYKKHRYPQESPEKQFWLDMKNIGYQAFCADGKMYFSEDLHQFVAAELEKLIPFYRFMLAAGDACRNRQLENEMAAKGTSRAPQFDW